MKLDHRSPGTPARAGAVLAIALCVAALAQHQGFALDAAPDRARELDEREMVRTAGGATIDFTGNPAPINGAKFHQLADVARIAYSGSETVILESWVNGSKTGAMEAISSPTPIPQNSAWNGLRIPMLFPPPATANIELRYSLSPDPSGNPGQSYASYGGDATKKVTWSTHMKVAGVNVWNVRGEGMTASFGGSSLKGMMDNFDGTLWDETTDAILTGRLNAFGSNNADTINCWNEGWNFAFNKVRTIDLGDADCLNPWVALTGFTSQGPNPPCPNFATKVTNALAAADAAYGDYVNVVVLDGAVKWNPNTQRYEDVSAYGLHLSGRQWSISMPTAIREIDSLTIVHEFGHEMGFSHKANDDPACRGRQILGDRALMCDGGGEGVDKAFCDRAVSFTGIRNFNPTH